MCRYSGALTMAGAGADEWQNLQAAQAAGIPVIVGVEGSVRDVAQTYQA
jgi:hypothetical protein